MMATFQYPFDFAIRKELLFSNFVDTGSNAALLHYLQGFGAAPDRLCYLWGSTGCGKTHLLQALMQAHALCQPGESAVYLPLRQLLDYGPAMLDGLESLDLLVLDDLQAIAGKPDWEHRLFQSFNALLAGRGRLCIAAAEAPGQLPLQLADLRSRLQLCVQFEVQQLDDAGKARALQHNARQRGLELREDVVHFIMLRSARNMHDLMAVLDRLDQLSLVEQRRLTIPFVKASLGW
jgi:DnaA family protein